MVRKRADFETNLKDFVTNMKPMWNEFEVSFSKESRFIAEVNLPQFKTIEFSKLNTSYDKYHFMIVTIYEKANS